VTTEEERPTQTTSQNNTSTQSGLGEARKAGITLEISPTISPNDYLRLNIKLEVSRFVGQFDPNSVTGGGVTLRRTIQTQVTMPSDDTMVLGGVIEDSESQSDGGVPFLKDLPLLGFLFRRSENSSNKTNLYFFVTPTILDEPHDFHDLWQLSLQKKMEAEQYIGTRRLQLVDKKWTGSRAGTPMTLEDPGATIEDLDKQGGNEMPKYQRAERVMPERAKAGTPSGPTTPTDAPAPQEPKKQ
jgi:type II secretory pathway component GspD/PulD (secretin)